MKIGIVGLGYVGLTTAACLLRRRHVVVGFELSDEKRRLLENRQCPLSEPGVAAEIVDGIDLGAFEVRKSIADSTGLDLLMVSVGTPSDERGGTDLRAVRGVLEEVEAVREQGGLSGTEIVIRSTLPPGTLDRFERRFDKLFSELPVIFFPEFLREGTAMSDFENPPQTVLGVAKTGLPPNKTIALLAEFGFSPRLVDAVSAEALKFACNAFHAMKVVFGNEIGRVVATLGGDAQEVMDLFINDTDLNISKKYLKPGTPYGGSCLPKDTRSLVNLGNSLGLGLELVRSCNESNRAHFDFIVSRIVKCEARRVGILGLSFKKNTDDLRESPSLELLYRLSATGKFDVFVHDFLVSDASAIGVNRDLLNRLISFPEIIFDQNLCRVLENVDVVVVMHNDSRYRRDQLGDFRGKVIDVANWLGV